MVYFLILFLVFFNWGNCFFKYLPDGYGIGKFFSLNLKVIEELNLDQKTSEEVKKIYLKHREEIIDLKAKLQKEMVNLEELILKEEISENDFLEGFEKLLKIRENILKEKALFLFKLKRLLPPEEWEKLWKILYEKGNEGRFRGKSGRIGNFIKGNFLRQK